MVEIYSGEGQTISQLAREVGIQLTGLRKITIIGSEERSAVRLVNFRADVLKALSRYPQYNKKSVLFENVSDGKIQGDHLFVPDSCPILAPMLWEGQDLPSEGETFIAEAWQKGRKKESINLFVLVDNLESASKIARRQALTILKCDERKIRWKVEAVTSEEFETRLEERIKAGGRVPVFMLRFGRLQKFLAQRAESGDLSF